MTVQTETVMVLTIRAPVLLWKFRITPFVLKSVDPSSSGISNIFVLNAPKQFLIEMKVL